MIIELRNGDCLEEMDKLIKRGVVVDSIIADVPYGTRNCKWDSVIPFNEMWIRLNKLIKPNGAIVLFGSEPFSSALRMSNIKNYKYDWIWDKKSTRGFLNAKIRPLKRYENILVFANKKPLYFPIKEIKEKVHPTQKPVALMEYLVKTYTNENETVLDFTMSSCSIRVACENTIRNFIGIEID